MTSSSPPDRQASTANHSILTCFLPASLLGLSLRCLRVWASRSDRDRFEKALALAEWPIAEFSRFYDRNRRWSLWFLWVFLGLLSFWIGISGRFWRSRIDPRRTLWIFLIVEFWDLQKTQVRIFGPLNWKIMLGDMKKYWIMWNLGICQKSWRCFWFLAFVLRRACLYLWLLRNGGLQVTLSSQA